MPENSGIYALKEDLHQMEERLAADIKGNRDKIQKNSEEISELKVLYSTLADLPKTMAAFDKTMDKVCNRLDNMDNNLKAMNEAIASVLEENKSQNSEIHRIDEKSKVDWSKAITDNFWKLVLVLGVIYYVVKDMVH